MFDELKNAVKAQLYERAISPLSGAFILSWVAWNYRFVLVLISSLSFTEKISYIDTHIFPTSQQTIIYGLFLPFLSAMCWLVLYPYPAKFFYEVSRKLQRELKELQQKIDDEMPMDQEEARKIRRESLQAEIEFDRELKSKNDEISHLKGIVDQLQRGKNAPLPTSKIKSITSDQNIRDKELDTMQYEILSKVAGSDTNGIFLSDLLSEFSTRTGSDLIIARHCIDELEQIHYIRIKDGMQKRSDDPEYISTKEGRAFLVKNRRPN